MTQQLSVIVPVYCNERTLLELRDRLLDTLDTIAAVDPKVIFVDDASSDESWSVIETMASADPRVLGLRLVSNVGQLRALCAGLDTVGGEILVSIDADLEQPPEAIPRLVRAFREGHDLVATKRIGRPAGSIRGLGSVIVNFLARLVRLPVSDVGSSFLVCSPQVAAEIRRTVERTGRQMILPTVFNSAVNPTTIEVELSTKAASAYTPWRAVRFGGEFVVAELGPVAGRRALLASVYLFALSVLAPSRKHALWFAASMAGLGLIGLLIPHTFRRSRNEPLYEVDTQVGHV